MQKASPGTKALLICLILQPFFSAVGKVWEAWPGSNGAGVSRSAGAFFRSGGPDEGQEPPPHQEDVVWVTHRGDERIHPKRYDGDLWTRLDSFRSVVLWKSPFHTILWVDMVTFPLTQTYIWTAPRSCPWKEILSAMSSPSAPTHQAPKAPTSASARPTNRSPLQCLETPKPWPTQGGLRISAEPSLQCPTAQVQKPVLLPSLDLICVVARCHVSFSLTAGCCSAV